jgi:hypothetical protein
MDGRTKPSELYVVDHNNNILDEDNEKKSNETINDTEGWAKNGITADVIKIATITDDIATTKNDVDGQEQLLKYYMEEPTGLGIIKDTRTKGILFYTINLCEPTISFEGELFHSRRVSAPICFKNLLSLLHMLVKKNTRQKAVN